MSNVFRKHIFIYYKNNHKCNIGIIINHKYKFFHISVLKSRTGIRTTVSPVLGSRVSERETITTEQVRLGIGISVQL